MLMRKSCVVPFVSFKKMSNEVEVTFRITGVSTSLSSSAVPKLLKLIIGTKFVLPWSVKLTVMVDEEPELDLLAKLMSPPTAVLIPEATSPIRT